MAPETRLPSHDFFLARSDHEKYVYVHTRGVVSCMSTNRFFISNSLLYQKCVCSMRSLPIDALIDLPRIHNKSHRSVVDQRHVHHRTKDSVLDLVRLTIFARN
jgi:hypothetical protein